MSKKKKKDKKQKLSDVLVSNYIVFDKKEKKSMDKKFRNAIQGIESMRMELYEADKKANKKERKKINKQQSEFYTSIESIKCRQKMARNWEKTGWLDSMIDLLGKASPYIKLLAKGICLLIVSFLSIGSVKQKISTDTLKKITTVFNIASTV